MQAYRHLYVLASEPRCVHTVDVHTREPSCVPLSIVLKQGQSSALQQPVAGMHAHLHHHFHRSKVSAQRSGAAHVAMSAFLPFSNG